MRAEIAASGVKVTSIQPGDVLSELYNHRMDRKVNHRIILMNEWIKFPVECVIAWI